MDLKHVPIEYAWFSAIALGVILAIRFAQLMPSWSFRLRVFTGCLVGFIGSLIIDHVRGGTLGSGLFIFSIVAFSLLVATAGHGAEIREVAGQIYEHPEEKEQPQVSWKYGAKAVTLMTILFVVWEMTGISFQ